MTILNNVIKPILNFLPVLMLSFFCAINGCTHPVRRLVFQPHEIQTVPPFPENVKNIERHWLQTEQGDVEWWLFEGDRIGDQCQRPAILMAHGNRELIDYFIYRAQSYQRIGFTVLLGEYRGYGRSAGTPNRNRIASDFRRYYDQLIALPTVDPNRIVFHGRSLGGGVLSELSKHRRPAAIIVESTFTSIKAMAYGAPDFLLSDNYDTLSALQDYSGPILIIHGNEDKVVSVDHAIELKNKIPHAELSLYNCGHSDGRSAWQRYWPDIVRFLDRKVLYRNNSTIIPQSFELRPFFRSSDYYTNIPALTNPQKN